MNEFHIQTNFLDCEIDDVNYDIFVKLVDGLNVKYYKFRSKYFDFITKEEFEDGKIQ